MNKLILHEKTWKRFFLAAALLAMLAFGTACSTGGGDAASGTEGSGDGGDDAAKSGEVYVLFTNDVHCGIDEGFGYAGLQQVRDNLEGQGYETILVDNGDSFQGEAVGLLSKGETILDLMNDVGYDIAVPGNHDFDYGADRFLELAKKADFPYICCNFNHEGKPVFDSYVIKEAAGIKIAFIGVATPESLTKSNPKNFQNDKGECVYDFLQDDTGEKVYAAVQNAIDDARKDGADLVYVMGHLGLDAESSPWTYADVIEHTSGIDVFLDGHSHDTEQIVMKDKDGNTVVRSSCGTKLVAIGYSHITADKQVDETNIWDWPNKDSAPDLLMIKNEMADKVAAALAKVEEQVGQVIGSTPVDLTINDPKEVDSAGNPIRMVRRADTNMGDFVADAYRTAAQSDISIVAGGSIRDNIPKGDVTYESVLDVMPFDDSVRVLEATGQQILDALEWGAKDVPDEFGGFLQVSGMTYEIDTTIPSGCKINADGLMTGIEGARRVSNVTIGGKPLDPDKKYTVAGEDFTVTGHGDGYTAFDKAAVVNSAVGTGSQLIINYLTDTLGGKVSTDYSDPYGQGRIEIKQ